jgi:hypothetical protein
VPVPVLELELELALLLEVQQRQKSAERPGWSAVAPGRVIFSLLWRM